jgi:hypothetical protein
MTGSAVAGANPLLALGSLVVAFVAITWAMDRSVRTLTRRPPRPPRGRAPVVPLSSGPVRDDTALVPRHEAA